MRPEKIKETGRWGFYKIYRGVFETAGHSLEKWHQWRADVNAKWEEKRAIDRETSQRRRTEASGGESVQAGGEAGSALRGQPASSQVLSQPVAEPEPGTAPTHAVSRNAHGNIIVTEKATGRVIKTISSNAEMGGTQVDEPGRRPEVYPDIEPPPGSTVQPAAEPPSLADSAMNLEAP